MGEKKRRKERRQNRLGWKKVRGTKRVACKDSHGKVKYTKDQHGNVRMVANVKKVKTEEYVRA